MSTPWERERAGAFLAKALAAFVVLSTCLNPVSLAQEPPANGDIEGPPEVEPATTAATGEDVLELPELLVEAERPLTSASDFEFRAKDFINLPHQTPSDLLRIVPGIHISQHTGGAKAHQIFLRGFDCEHGQDFAGYLDNIPLNQVSQVHGEGYLDLHFLIPETVERLGVIKGPYDPQHGNYSVAGLMNIRPAYDFEESSVKLQGGSFGTLRGLAQLSLGEGHTLALEADRTDGFTDPGESSGKRLFTSHVLKSGGRKLKVLYTHFDSEYAAADVVPMDLVENGTIGRFDGMDPSDGGVTEMDILGVKYEGTGDDRDRSLLVYGGLIHTDLYSNYTYYLFDQDNGDQMRLYDRRWTAGLRLKESRYGALGGRELRSTWGIDLRGDRVHQIQAQTDEREPFNTLSDYEFWQESLGAFCKAEIKLTDRVRFVPGIRWDLVYYDIDGTQDIQYFNVETNKIETLDDARRGALEYYNVLSPKASLILDLYDDPTGRFSGAQVFANYGEGFTSPKASLVANHEVESIPKSRAGEVSCRLNFLEDRLSVSPGLWVAHKEMEMVFEPETGVSVPRGSSLRYGFDLEARYQPRSDIYLYLDYFATTAVFTKGWSDIPGTPEGTVTLGGNYEGRSGLGVSFRTRVMAPRPLAGGVYSRPYSVTDAAVNYRKGDCRFELAVENLFDQEWDDTSFYYESRPDPAAPACEQLHITPGTPLSVKLSLVWGF